MATAAVRRSTRKGCPNHAIEFKRELAATTCTPGISVAKLAREHGINANQLFRWRGEYRAGKFGAPNLAHTPVPLGTELPVTVGASGAAVTLLPVQAPAVQTDPAAPAACIEVVFRSATVRISGAPEMASLRVVLDTLARR